MNDGKYWFFFFLFVVIFLLIAGCSSRAKPVDFYNPSLYMPTNAQNITKLGENWFTFELEIDGKIHKFLYGHDGRTATITELTLNERENDNGP